MKTLIEDFKDLRKILNEISYLKKEVKRRSMVFQCELKERRAKELGLPLWAFYHMPYADIGLLRKKEQALRWFRAHREEMEQQEKEVEDMEYDEPISCPNCGKLLNGDDWRCFNCGAEV